MTKFEWVTVGFSISTVSDGVYEPGVVPLERRIRCLRELSAKGIRTWVSMAPVVPQLILADLESLIRRLREAGVSAVRAGLLRFQCYEESRKMFEGVTRRAWTDFLADSGQTIARINELLRKYDLDSSAKALHWNPPEREHTIDSFAS